MTEVDQAGGLQRAAIHAHTPGKIISHRQQAATVSAEAQGATINEDIVASAKAGTAATAADAGGQ